MMAEEAKKPREMPKGGRKGGAVFPRISLADALEYNKKLISKTHAGPQEKAAIYAVVKSKGPRGDVKISALKQYGLIQNKGDQYSATEFASKLASADDDLLTSLRRKACLLPKVFNELFKTFHGDQVAKGKLRQRVAELKVHPDELDNCVDLFLSSMLSAKLGTQTGDQVVLLSEMGVRGNSATSHGDRSEIISDELESEEELGAEEQLQGSLNVPKNPDLQSNPPLTVHSNNGSASTKPNVTLNITVDSTMDPDKLLKQLELLRQYGAL